jgi:hypothetical protein
MTEVMNADGTPHQMEEQRLMMMVIFGLVLSRVFYYGY